MASFMEVDEARHERIAWKDVVCVDTVEGGIAGRLKVSNGGDWNSPSFVFFGEVNHMFALGVDDIATEG